MLTDRPLRPPSWRAEELEAPHESISYTSPLYLGVISLHRARIRDSGSWRRLSTHGAALDLLARGDAGVLLVAKLDRATRSVMDAANLLARSQHEGWKLIALDLGLDPTTPTGELVATIMAAVVQWERRAIGVRTREALAAKRAQGVRLGRPSVLSAEIVARIVEAHRAGAGWSTITRQLNAEGVLTAHGGAQWHPSTVRAIVPAQVA